MPLYFIDLTGGSDSWNDEEGYELPDLAAVVKKRELRPVAFDRRRGTVGSPLDRAFHIREADGARPAHSLM
jgi:hypothetical protein